MIKDTIIMREREFQVNLSWTSAKDLVTFMEDEAGEYLRSIAHYDGKDREILYLRDEIDDQYSEDELEGVIAHELAHIKNQDVITRVVGQSIGMIVGYVAYPTGLCVHIERNPDTYLLARAPVEI